MDYILHHEHVFSVGNDIINLENVGMRKPLQTKVIMAEKFGGTLRN
jgi:hypothetical protein